MSKPTCAECGKEFAQRNAWHLTCCAKCTFEYWKPILIDRKLDKNESNYTVWGDNDKK